MHHYHSPFNYFSNFKLILRSEWYRAIIRTKCNARFACVRVNANDFLRRICAANDKHSAANGNFKWAIPATCELLYPSHHWTQWFIWNDVSMLCLTMEKKLRTDANWIFIKPKITAHRRFNDNINEWETNKCAQQSKWSHQLQMFAFCIWFDHYNEIH